MGPMPALGGPSAPGSEAVAVPADADPPAVPQWTDARSGDDIGRAMDRLLGSSRALRGPASTPRPEPADAAPQPGSPAAELVQLAGDLETLGLSAARAGSARAALLALARAAQSEAPTWELVVEVLGHAGATPALARRVLPLLLEFIAKAA